jgi:hypothetical protein
VAFMVDGHLVSFDTVCKHSRHVVVMMMWLSNEEQTRERE